MVSTERWERAQKYESGYWQGIAQEVESGSLQKIGFYEWRAGEVMKRFDRSAARSVLTDEARILEVGSGPIGIAGFLPGLEKVAVDPLNSSYEQNPGLVALRRPDVQYLGASGENMPLPDARFDIVIIENCIDHVLDVHGVMSEVKRVLKSGGILYLTVNARSRPGYWMHRLLARLSLDPGHPHTFTEKRLEHLLKKHGFELMDFECGSWWNAWRSDLTSRSWKGRAKGVLIVSEYVLSAVCRRS